MLKQKPAFRLREREPETVEKRPKTKNQEKVITATGLMWIGLGGIIGAGFFLASGLPIGYAGPGVVLGYLIGGLLMAQVAGALTSLSVNHPVRGSFRVYAEEILGPFMGFLLGWAFWVSAILGIGSETIAMAIFSQLWFPAMPVWALTLIYSLVVIALNAFGLKNFGRVESLMSFIKVLALILFVVVALAAVLGLLGAGRPVGMGTLLGHGGFLPNGFSGLFKSMLIVIFAYSGISVVALATSEVREPKRNIPKAMLRVIVILIGLYVCSLLAVMSLTPWTEVSANESPFVKALASVNVPFLPSVMNAIILVAAFSVMVGAYFSAMTMLVSLGEGRKAPRSFAKSGKNGVFYTSLIVTAGGITVIIAASYILPGKIYSYLTSASAYFSFFNWGAILVTFLVWRRRVKGDQQSKSPLAFGAPSSTVISLLVILILFVFSLSVLDQRMGFYFALIITVIIAFAYLIWKRAVHSDASTKNNGPG